MGNRITVVVVDAHAELCRLLARGLDALEDFSVLAHTTRVDVAAQLSRETNPHIVLAGFPGQSKPRLEDARLLAGASPKSKLIIHTPYYLPGQQEAFRAAGAIRCLLKGLTVRELSAELRNAAKDAGLMS